MNFGFRQAVRGLVQHSSTSEMSSAGTARISLSK
jgi:hypothetical protein